MGENLAIVKFGPITDETVGSLYLKACTHFIKSMDFSALDEYQVKVFNEIVPKETRMKDLVEKYGTIPFFDIVEPENEVLEEVSDSTSGSDTESIGTSDDESEEYKEYVFCWNV